MARNVKYLGWFLWTDTGDPYRKWSFESAVEQLGAATGDYLYDYGPEYGDKRFDVRGPDAAARKSRFALEAVEGALNGKLPRWKPPSEASLRMTDAIKSLSSAMGDVVRAIDRAGADRKALAAIKNVVDGTRTPGKPPVKSETQNKYLRLKGDFKYDNGNAYVEWEFLVDVPEIPVTRLQGASPMHAAKGDVLREDDDDELTPFELRRDGRRIGDPEWWQVRHLFAGIKNDSDVSERNVALSPTVAYLRSLVPHRVWSAIGRDHFGYVGLHAALLARASVPGTPILKGDIVLQLSGPGNREPPGLRGQRIRVPRQCLATVADHLTSLTALEMAGSRGVWQHTLEKLEANLRARQKPAWKDATSPLLVVRSLVGPISEPILATSDDAALFELLARVGGRMPTA